MTREQLVAIVAATFAVQHTDHHNLRGKETFVSLARKSADTAETFVAEVERYLVEKELGIK